VFCYLMVRSIISLKIRAFGGGELFPVALWRSELFPIALNRLGLPAKLRRSLACINSIENMIGPVRRVCRNVKRWRNAAMALRWTADGMMEAAKGFRRLKAYKHLPVLRAALAAHQSK
jgi:putative transposase